MRSISARVRRPLRTFCAPGRKILGSARSSTIFWRGQGLLRSAGRLHRSLRPRRDGTSSSFSWTAPPWSSVPTRTALPSISQMPPTEGSWCSPTSAGTRCSSRRVPAHHRPVMRISQRSSGVHRSGSSRACGAGWARLRRRVGVKPVWLSTAGAGVAWVHVRLDDRPKYYGYDAYRRAPRLGS